jgi:hypothetical protein
VRGDSGFCREEIMAWCEGQEEVYYCLGLAKNSVLVERLGPALANAQIRWCLSGAANVRQFAEFEYQTIKSWSRPRRVIGKAEVTGQGPNPRFIVTNLPVQGFKDDEAKTRFMPARLYEELYCARGEMENMLKQQTLDLRADRMSTHYLASNQLRLWLSALAYLLLERLHPGLGRDATDPGDCGQCAAQALQGGRSGAGECAPGLCAVKQRLSAAGVVSPLPPAADEAGALGRLKPKRPVGEDSDAGGVGQNRR